MPRVLKTSMWPEENCAVTPAEDKLLAQDRPDARVVLKSSDFCICNQEKRERETYGTLQSRSEI